MIRALLGGGGDTKCRTIDVCDIFKDGSGKALYRLDGNANDTGGNYHGTETAITYGGGVYERGAIATSGRIDCGSGSKLLIPHNGNFTISGWVKRVDGIRTYIATRMNASSQYGDSIYWESDNKIGINFATSATTQVFTSTTSTHLANGNYRHICYTVNRSTNTYKVYVDNVEVAMGSITVPTVGYDNNLNTLLFSNHSALSSGQLDQVRFFNRALTASEVQTLYAECAPTSTVDNINPFEDGSLKAFYKFDGDATDSTGGTAWTTSNMVYSTGKFGQCADFTTSAPTASISSSVVTGYASTGFCISAWINMNNVTADSSPMCTNIPSYTYFITPIRVYNGYVYSQFGLAGTSSVQTPATSLAVKVNTWHFVVFRFNPDKTLQMSLDGGAFTAKSSASGYNLSQVVNQLMLFSNGVTDYSTGKIAQVRIFNKALTPMEVASLYNETTPLEEPMHSLVDPFKDGSGKALYRLDGNALDESGNYNGTQTSGSWVVGRFARGYQVLNANSQYITTSGKIDNSEVSFSCWVKPNVINTTQTLISSRDSTNTDGTGIMVRIENDDISFIVKSNAYWLYANNLITSGNWHHIVCVVSSTNAKIYHNGTLVATGATTTLANLNGTNSNNYRFCNTYNNSQPLNGIIDQVRIFNRALTASEVTALYQEI